MEVLRNRMGGELKICTIRIVGFHKTGLFIVRILTRQVSPFGVFIVAPNYPGGKNALFCNVLTKRILRRF